MENDEPAADDPVEAVPAAAPERDAGHVERLGRLGQVQASIEQDAEEEEDQDSPASPDAAVQDGAGGMEEDGDDDDDNDDTDTRSTNSSENGLDDSDADRLFDDYITAREQQQAAAEIYNTELPTEHAYLGKLERVEGVDYMEPGKIYRLPVCSHNSIVFPGEVVPMIINAATLNCTDPSDGVKFGLVFRNVISDKYVYGVTCQVFERGELNASSGSIVLKTIAQQRFRTVRHLAGRRADVLILPEIILPDPLISSCSNLMMRHAVSNSAESAQRFKSFLSRTVPWPKFVYDLYGTDEVLTKVDRYLALLKIENVPSDPVKLSFWLARNIPIDENDRKKIYEADAVISRMMIINKSLDQMCYFMCKRCSNEIGSYNDLFAMSKQGVQTSYCNPSGFVHETLTIYKTRENSTFTTERPSTEFSWFPGYSWQITLCSNCRNHLGWKFVATKKNYLPKSFYGLSGNSIQVKSVNRVGEEEDATDDAEEDGQQQPRHHAGDSDDLEQQRQRLPLELFRPWYNDVMDDDDDDTESDDGGNEMVVVQEEEEEQGGGGDDEEEEEIFQDARE
uniref:Protein cereblon n=1 Tax=Culex pipiens TaxID=7175 RepID=A0A8D8L012_CULPI